MCVVAVAAVDGVAAAVAPDGVAAVIAVKLVVAEAARDPVDAIAATDDIVALSPQDHVSATAAEEDVVPVAAEQRVIAEIAVEDVDPAFAIDRVVSAVAVDHIVAPARVDGIGVDASGHEVVALISLDQRALRQGAEARRTVDLDEVAAGEDARKELRPAAPKRLIDAGSRERASDVGVVDAERVESSIGARSLSPCR